MIELSEEQFRANRFELISRLADDLAHEIKNPLNAIVINLEVLKVRLARGDAAAAADRVPVIEDETRRLHSLIDRLLQLLRPDRDEASSMALDQALDELLPLIEAQVRLARNELHADCAAVVFVPVRRDVFRFAFLNVVTLVHDVLGEGGGSLDIACVVGDAEVRLAVTAHPAAAVPGGARIPDPRRLRFAGQLLAAGGGTLETNAAGVTLILPRGAPA